MSLEGLWRRRNPANPPLSEECQIRWIYFGVNMQISLFHQSSPCWQIDHRRPLGRQGPHWLILHTLYSLCLMPSTSESRSLPRVACKQIIATRGKMFVSRVLTDDNNTRGRHTPVSRGPLSVRASQSFVRGQYTPRGALSLMWRNF